jgi:D-aminoacyl-tRNA deacylase
MRTGLQYHTTDLRVDGHPVERLPQLGDALLVRTPEVHITDETLDARLREAHVDADVIIFLSKHKSESGRPTLTAHPMGNYGPAQFGGRPHRLTPSPAAYLSQALRCLARARAEHDFPAEVSFEATHHGPLLETPSMFLELGSSEREWEDPRGHRVLADAVRLLLSQPVPEHPIVIGLGGGHYGPRFTEAVLGRRVSVAHILPTYHAKDAQDIEALAEETVRASPGAEAVYYQDGTIPKEPRERWLAAFNAQGLATASSKDWPSLTP